MPAGRPTKYKPEIHLPIVEAWAVTGATDVELAEKLKVTVSTFYLWKSNHKEFSEAVKKGKDAQDDIVESALLQRAKGIEVEEEKAFCFEGEITKTTIKKKLPPETAAMAFWLKNRRPEKWRDKQELDIQGDIKVVFDKDDEELL